MIGKQMRRRLLLLALALALALAAGCGPKKADPPFDAGFHLDAGDFDAGEGDCTAHEPAETGIVFGSGEAEWREVSDGDVLPFVRGPQNGYHFYGSVKERGIDVSDNVIVAFAVFDGDDQINDGLGVYARPLSWVSIGDGWHAAVGFYVVMNIDGPEDVDGHTLCILTRVLDASDRPWVDERTISLRFDGPM